jgi:hypothetical protein
VEKPAVKYYMTSKVVIGYQSGALLCYGTIDYRAEFMIIVWSDVLKHSNRNIRIISSSDAAVIVLHILYLVLQPFNPGLLASINDLLMRYIVRLDADALPPGHVARQRSPAATCLNHTLSRLQAQLATDKIHFCNLGISERNIRIAKLIFYSRFLKAV